jgi:hypothetical protein
MRYALSLRAQRSNLFPNGVGLPRCARKDKKHNDTSRGSLPTFQLKGKLVPSAGMRRKNLMKEYHQFQLSPEET